MPSNLPSDKAIKDFIKSYVAKNAKENNGQVTASVRVIREALADHFDVDSDDLKESKKDVIKTTAQQAADAVGKGDADGDEGDDAASAETVSKPEAPKPKAKAAKKASPKSASPQSEAVLDSDMSELDDTDQEAESSTATKKKRSSTSGSDKKAKTAKRKPRASGGDGSSNSAEDEVVRLKKFVVACGVRKQWKGYFAGQKPPAESPSEQAKLLRSLLAELGMAGRLSMDKAKKIKEKREFEEEMRAIGVDTSGDVGGGGSGGGRSRSGKVRQSLAEDGSDEEGQDDDEEEDAPRPPKKAKFNSSLAAFAAELNSDDDD